MKTSKEMSHAFDAYFRERGWNMSKTVNPSGFIEYHDARTDLLWTGWRSAMEPSPPMDATQDMCDSVRYLLIGIEQPGCTFGSIRKHCRWAGMDVDNWPHWTVNRDTEHFNKSARAALIWWLMHREAVSVTTKAEVK